MIENWAFRKRPARLERRIEFDNYDLTREFLDLTADLSEREGFYPDMNFGKTHVSMTIHLDQQRGVLGSAERRFAEAVNHIAPCARVSTPLEGTLAAERN